MGTFGAAHVAFGLASPFRPGCLGMRVAVTDTEKLLSLPFMIATDGNKLNTNSQSTGGFSGGLVDQYPGPGTYWPSHWARI